MTFWAYMLHCRGGYFYTGHTDDLDRRMAQHQYGKVQGFASEHRPVELVWSQEFESRIEALEAERRIKGWSRAKKMALIRGDWSGISRLAKGKDRASTSSARTDAVLNTPLARHPDTPAAIRSVEAVLTGRSAGVVRLAFYVTPGAVLAVPAPTVAARTDGLWQRTCFELFLKPDGGEGYFEFNLSPSGQWAAYAFDGYRAGMRDLELPVDPRIELERPGEAFVLEADIDLTAIPPGRLGASFSAVIEETDGTKSYWALRHPPGKPDFHHPDCFALELPAPERP